MWNFVKYVFIFNSLRNKLLFTYMLIILAFLSVGLFVIDHIGKEMVKQSITREKKDVLQLKENLANYLNRYIDLSTEIFFDKTMMDYLMSYSGNRGESASGFYTILKPTFQKYKNLWPEIDKITVYTNNPTLMSNDDEISYVDPQSTEWPMYQEALKSRGKIKWQLHQNDQGAFKIRLNRALLLDNFEVGVLSIFVDQEQLNGFFKENIEGNEINIFGPKDMVFGSTRPGVLGTNGLHLSDYRSNEHTLRITDEVINKKPVKVISTNMDLGKYSPEQWAIIKIVSNNLIMQEVKVTKQYLIYVFIIVISLVILFSFLIAHHLGGRMRNLSHSMRKLQEGNFSALVIDKNNDEISYLAKSFNKMARRLEVLVRDNYVMNMQQMEMEVQRREAEMNALQSQINPHFLFNTLEAIIWGVHEKKEETAEVIMMLANNFRRILNWKEDFIPLSSELQFIEEYLRIQKFRLEDKLQWTVKVDDSLLSMHIPKMMIQPIIENAINHGIAMKKGNGHLKIAIEKKEGFVLMSISDDGVGINPEKLSEILGLMNDRSMNTSGKHIGMKNVFERMKIYFGDRATIQIYSEAGKGTTVKLSLPDRTIIKSGGVPHVKGSNS